MVQWRDSIVASSKTPLDLLVSPGTPEIEKIHVYRTWSWRRSKSVPGAGLDDASVRGQWPCNIVSIV